MDGGHRAAENRAAEGVDGRISPGIRGPTGGGKMMYKDRKVIVVMPAYNAAKTLEQTHAEVLAQGVVDLVIVVDDASRDETSALAKTLPRTIVHTHVKNLGYGGNQKSCYRLAMENGADIVIMVHPDYQYTP